MARKATLPFLEVRRDSIVAEPWMRGEPGESNDIIDDAWPAWDYQVDLHVCREIEVNLTSVQKDCQLPESAPLSLVCGWNCPDTGVRKSDFSVQMQLTDSTRVENPYFVIPGQELAGSVELLCELVLAEDIIDAGGLSATRAGSRLWSDRTVITLEGSRGRFPLQWINFKDAPWITVPGNPAWHLHCPMEHHEAPLLSDTCLFLNADHNQLHEIIDDPLVVSAMRCDLARRLISGSLRCADFPESLEDCVENSLALNVWGLIAACFPGKTLHDVRATQDNSPDMFDTHIQAAMGLFNATR